MSWPAITRATVAGGSLRTPQATIPAATMMSNSGTTIWVMSGLSKSRQGANVQSATGQPHEAFAENNGELPAQECSQNGGQHDAEPVFGAEES